MTEKGRLKWLTSRDAYEKSVRMLHESFPDSPTYAAQAQVLDQLAALTEELEAHRATSLGSKINELIVERGELREQSRALREAAEQASARLLEGSPIKGGQVFVPGSAADSLLKAADDARLMLREALKGGG